MTLNDLMRLGCAQVRIGCVQPRCLWSALVRIDKLLIRVPAETNLWQIARRARCRRCAARGAHVEPEGFGSRRSQ